MNSVQAADPINSTSPPGSLLSRTGMTPGTLPATSTTITRRVRYRLSSLPALLVSAMTPAGHDSITAAAEWCRRGTPGGPAAFGVPHHPLLGRYRVPGEKILRSGLGRLDPAELSTAGFTYLRSLLPDERVIPAPLMPDGGREHEQRRAHQAAAQADPLRVRRRAIAMDGKCLRGASSRRPC